MSKQAAWTLIDLAIHSEWREKCKREIQDLLSRHAGDTLFSATLSEKLKAVPISAWEDELPTFEACIRETQRIVFSSLPFRRNGQEEMKIGEQVVKRGDFLTYFLGDIHQNPKYYPEPHKSVGGCSLTRVQKPSTRSWPGEPVGTFAWG